jgi:hypothetical protein
VSSPDSPSPPASPGRPRGHRRRPAYKVERDGIYHLRTSDAGGKVALTNFGARIVADVEEDDGSGMRPRRLYEVEVWQGERTARVEVTSREFATLEWASDALGARAIVYPGNTNRDRVRTAIQEHSLGRGLDSRHVYRHSGWMRRAGADFYVHSAGAIGAAGSVTDVLTRLEDRQQFLSLPAPSQGDELRRAIRASLQFVELGPSAVVLPVLAAVYRAPLGEVNFSLHLVGPSGVFKTEMAAIAQQHFGAGFTSAQLPASWLSSANALEKTAFLWKDALMVVDDFRPGSGSDANRAHRDADRLIRGQGNRAGRGRMQQDTSLRPALYSRALLLSTGEDVPSGQSLRARMLILEVAPGDIRSDILAAMQANGAEGHLAAAMAGYVQWLAPRRALLEEHRADLLLAFREQARTPDGHRRTSDLVGDLYFGADQFTSYAQERGALSPDEAASLLSSILSSLQSAAETQLAHQVEGEPAARFVELLTSALVSGSAHLDGERAGEAPPNPSAWGWRMDAQGYPPTWRSQGPWIGWIDGDGDSVYYEPGAAYKAANRQADGRGEISVQQKTLGKRLKELGHLVTSDPGRSTARKAHGSTRLHVLHMRAEAFQAPAGDPTTIGRSHGPVSGQSGQWGQGEEGRDREDTERGQISGPIPIQAPENRAKESGEQRLASLPSGDSNGHRSWLPEEGDQERTEPVVARFCGPIRETSAQNRATGSDQEPSRSSSDKTPNGPRGPVGPQSGA